MRLRKSGTSIKDVENFLRGEVLHKGDVPAFRRRNSSCSS
jgi:hypothetical protein